MKSGRLIRWVLLSVLLLVIGGGLAWWYIYGQQRYDVRVTPTGHVQVSQREGTDEQPVTPAQKSAYTVAPDMPRYLTIDKIGVHARILKLGLNAKGEIAAPQGIWDTAWYDGSARPGEPGTSFIDGHISGPTLPAVFVRLNELTAGDVITIERGDGELLRYGVQTVESKRRDTIDMATILHAQDTSTERLVLMTCNGQFNAKKYTYNDRLIVTAARI